MKKHFLSWDFLFIIVVCLFGGMLDGYSFLFRDQTFCLIQTGNLIKCIVYLINGQYSGAIYASTIILTFCFFIFAFWLFIKFLKEKNINYHFVTMPLIAILLIPSIVWEFDVKNFLSYQNIISGMCVASIGSLMAILFKNVKFKFNKKLSFNAAMMTGNMRSMMESFAEFVKTKNKEKGRESICYLSIIIIFSIGVCVAACSGIFVISPWNKYLLFIVLYFLMISMIIVFHFRYKWIKKYETSNNIVS